jgi:hypothetical protein
MLVMSLDTIAGSCAGENIARVRRYDVVIASPRSHHEGRRRLTSYRGPRSLAELREFTEPANLLTLLMVIDQEHTAVAASA